MEKFNIDKYVHQKIGLLSATDKTFKSIYNLMFKDTDLVMFEWTDGSKIKKMSYGECKKQIEDTARHLKLLLNKVNKGKIVGLYASNSIRWVQVFWAILKCGYIPLLLNTRLDTDRLKETLSSYDIGAIISDSVTFDKDTININDISYDSNGDEINDWADEIIVMSSGTSLKAKLCVYSGNNFYYQLLDSANIIKQCKPIRKHYEGNLKQLMFLPLYHIFGLAAMFMWFAFFSRTFVVLKDQNPETILMTIRKHKVTHIFAVPLFWEVVYKKFKTTLNNQDEKTINKVNKGLGLVKKLKSLWLGKKLFKPVREKIFGESVCFLISGGSAISSEILTFFNSIGYHMANGYGMSEIGITSVELTSKFNNLTDCSVGKPFSHIEYKIDETGTLLVKGESMAKDIYIDGKRQQLVDGWYNTLDNAKCENGRYFICGRKDDMIIGPDGENINPAWIEKEINLNDIDDKCILKIKEKPTLLIQIGKFTVGKKIESIKSQARAELIRLGVGNIIRNIAFTNEPLISGNEFKINRRRLGEIKLIDENKLNTTEDIKDEIKVRLKELFASSINIPTEEINDNAHFFFDLNGNSLDYFSLMSLVQSEFSINLPQEEGKCLYTVNEFYNYIQKNNEKE